MTEQNELKAIRARVGLSQAAMAEAMGVPTRTYEDLEAGKSSIRPIHVKAATYAEKQAKGLITDEEVIWIHPFHVAADGSLVDEDAVRVYGPDIETTARHFFGDDIAFNTGVLAKIRGSIALVKNGKVDKRMVYSD